MPSNLLRRYAAPFCLVLAAGCAKERDPINRVQPDALAKSFFVGPDLKSIDDDPEFYHRGTIVDATYGTGQDGLFSSNADPISRIRWEITEDTLNARLSYERVKGTDGTGTQYDGVQLKTTNDGQIVASYKILEHFDIRRDYNEQTGEELNVVVENSTDEPWYDRQYFRVDWSKNLVTDAYDFDMLATLGIGDAVKYDSFAYTVLDPNATDAPHFSPDDGYFDVTTKVYATPQSVDPSVFGLESGTIPACLFAAAIFSQGTYPWGNCNPTELTVRESYRKVVDNDYEPMDFDGVRFQILGAFNFDYRRGYSRNYGMLDREWNRFIGRYNIWERSHFYSDPAAMTGAVPCATKETTEDPTGDPSADPNRDDDANGTADECESAGSGSRCDIYTQKCTLPYRQRTAKTIAWYVAGDTSLFDPTNDAVVEWDLAMKAAVQTARLTECKRTGGTDCDTQFPMWNGQQDDIDEAVRIARGVDSCRRADGWASSSCTDFAHSQAQAVADERGGLSDPGTTRIGDVAAMPPVIVLCHNPVIASDHPACGPAGTAPRVGDIRYNLVVNVPNPQNASPWGVMVDGTDPVTGEKVVGSMNIWTAVTDIAAQQLVDMVRYANGELSTSDITDGTYVRNLASAEKLGPARSMPTMPRAEVSKRLASATQLDAKAFDLATSAPPPADLRATMNAALARVADVQARNDVASPGQAKLQATLALARGTPVETQLFNGPMLQLAGAPAGTAVQGTAADRISPLALNNPAAWQRMRQLRDNALAARDACVIDEAPEPSSMTGLADILGAKFPKVDGESPADQKARYDRMVDYVRRKYHHSVIVHEMGHSIGLRHNFVSSAAPLFYRPQYWQLRTKNGRALTPCTDAVDDGASCVGPRYWDPVTDEEQSQLISMWMQSTVMDYPGDTSQDMLGLGVTDFAAARFFYGDVLSVYQGADFKAGSSIGTGISAATDTFGGLLGIRYGLKSRSNTGVDEFHYSQLQSNYHVLTGCYGVSADPPADWNETLNGKWNQVLDGGIVSIDGTPSKCREQPVDYVEYKSLRYPTSKELNDGFYSGGPSVDPQTSAVRVPYAFATDYWADLGNVSVFRHDNGADPYEQVAFLIATQEDHHILDDYRRGRSTFSIVSSVDHAFERFTSKLQGISSGVAFLSSIERDSFANAGISFDSYWPQIVKSDAQDLMIATTMAFDHFTRELARPEPGVHYPLPAEMNDPVLRSASDPDDFGPMGSGSFVAIPNGASGYFRDVAFGGHLLENSLATTNGDFNVEYLDNTGSYYDKVFTSLLMAESEDRFVSQSRRDFYDARFRAVGLADILPEGFRRVIANALTGDRSILAPRLAADAQGNALLDKSAAAPDDPSGRSFYPAQPIGWPSFWPNEGPQTCFASNGRDVCTSFNGDVSFSADAPATTVAIDPQIGWEVQKFIIAFTLANIKANEKTNWTDMMRIWKLGPDSSPGTDRRIEWQDPASGQVYYAADYGTECLFGDPANNCAGGKIVQKGIAARVLEYANQLTANGYKLDEVNYPGCTSGCPNTPPPGFNQYGRAMVARQPDGSPIIKADPAVSNVDPARGTLVPIKDCDQNQDSSCTPLTVGQNHFAYELQSYKSVPDYLWQSEMVYGWFDPPSTRGAD